MLKKKVLFGMGITAAAFFATQAHADNLATWTFSSAFTATDNVTVGPAATPASGTAANTSAATVSGLHASANSDWANTSGGYSVNTWAVNDYFSILAINTTGYQNIALAVDVAGSNTGPANFKLQYSTDNSTFTDSTNYSVTATLTTVNFNLASVTSLNNDSSIYFRLVDTSTTSINNGTVGTAGTSRIDNVTVTGSTIGAAPGIGSNPASFTATGYKQNFNTLVASGTSNATSTLPTGFATTSTTYDADDGSSNHGTTYSYGTIASSDRALGELSGGETPTFGFNLKNDTGTTLTKLRITFTEEQWRVANTTDDKLDFQYSTDATSLTDGTWIDFNQLDLTQIATPIGSAGAALDGNAVENQRAYDQFITGLNISAGNGVWLRWVGVNTTGSDAGLAIDNLEVAIPEPSTFSLAGISALGLLARRRARRNRSA